MMSMESFRKYMQNAKELKEYTEYIGNVINMLEEEMKYALESEDFEKLPNDAKYALLVPKARAIRYWNIKLDEFKDKVLDAMTNVVTNIKSKELEITLEEAIHFFDRNYELTVTQISGPPIKITKVTEEVVDAVEEKPKAVISDEDILKTLINKKKEQTQPTI